MIVGDFNSVIAAEEVSHGERFNKRRCTGFLNWIYEQELIDLGFTGPCFTWTRGTSTFSFKGARLDRALCNPEWRFTFERATVTHLPKLSPLLIKPCGMRDAIPKPFFRFQAAWLTHPGLKKVVNDNWLDNLPLPENIPTMSTALDMWNKHHFGNIFVRKRRLWARLVGIQKQLSIQKS